MLIPLTTGVHRFIASELDIKPNYSITLTRFKSFLSKLNTLANFNSGNFFIHLVGKDAQGSIYNLFSIEVDYNKPTSTVTFKLGFRGTERELGLYPWYYLDPAGTYQAFDLASFVLASITNDTRFKVNIVGKTLEIYSDNTALVRTAWLRDPISIWGIYGGADAFDTAGSPISGVSGLVELDVETAFDLSSLLPVMIGLAVASAVIGILMTFVKKIG